MLFFLIDAHSFELTLCSFLLNESKCSFSLRLEINCAMRIEVLLISDKDKMDNVICYGKIKHILLKLSIL